MVRLIYENTAIGMIAQRIGECRFFNRIAITSAITQQTPLEQKYRDALFNVDDKIAIIEFKAPEYRNRKLRYEDIPLGKLKTLRNTLGGRNVFIALIHALLLPNYYIKSTPTTSLHYWYAVTATTVFIPLSEIEQHVTGETINLTLNNVYNPININYIDDFMPTCAKQTYLTKQEPICISCGGLYSGPNKLKRPLLEISIKSTSTRVIGYTFASFIKSLYDCTIGYELTHESIKQLHTIHEIARQEGYTCLLLVTKEKVINLVPLSVHRQVST